MSRSVERCARKIAQDETPLVVGQFTSDGDSAARHFLQVCDAIKFFNAYGTVCLLTSFKSNACSGVTIGSELSNNKRCFILV
jgi:hypothetical protein